MLTVPKQKAWEGKIKLTYKWLSLINYSSWLARKHNKKAAEKNTSKKVTEATKATKAAKITKSGFIKQKQGENN